MGLFDRFRAQPKWKHADAAVRLAGIEEIPTEDQALLATLAREDPDARVRRAAVRKLYDPAVLKEVAARDQDADVREDASGVLLDLAAGAFEDSSEAESLKALDHLDDQRLLASVAKTANAEAVSLAALSRLVDPKAIGSVARRAVHAPTRLEALARVDDAEEVFAIAMRTEHRDVGLAAVERIANPDQLKALAARAAQKAVVRRARTLTRGSEDTAAPVAQPQAPAPVAERDWDLDRDRICRSVEEAAAERDWRTIESRLAAADTQWGQVERDAPTAAEPPRIERMAAARERAMQAIARLKQQDAEQAERVEQSARQQAERAAACARLEGIAAMLAREAAGEAAAADSVRPQDVPAEIEAARRAWLAMSTPLVPGEEMERLQRRFERACGACEREAERCRENLAKRARLVELVEQAEAIAGDGAAATPDQGAAVTADRSRWPAVRQEWIDLGGARVAGESLVSRFEAAQATIVRRETEAREQEHKRQREALQRLQEMCGRLEQVASQATLTLKDGERALRDVRTALDQTAALSKRDRAEIADRLKAVQTALFPRVQELREADDWLRWANVSIQEDLCRKAQGLREVTDAAEAARQLRELQQQWKNASAVPRDKAQGLWERFKTAADEVHARAEIHFAQEATERAANLERKQALCQEAEALAESSDWIKTAEAIKQLQAEWRTIGPVSRGHEKAVWERFRAACDRFFTRRREDLTRRKEEWSANLARKEALIVQAEALAGTSDWTRGFDELKRLQAEWKTVGPVRKNRADQVWQRFRGACDQFFERYQQRDQIQVAANIAEREKICTDLEALLPEGGASCAPAEHAVDPDAAELLPEGGASSAPGEDVVDTAAQAPADLAARVAAIRALWAHSPTLMPRDTLAQLNARYAQALDRLVRAFPEPFGGTDLDPEANRRKAEELCARLEAAAPSDDQPQPAADQTPTSILAARLREALAANTIGGGVAVAEQEARSRAVAALVKEAQGSWPTLGPHSPELQSRFERACRRAMLKK